MRNKRFLIIILSVCFLSACEVRHEAKPLMRGVTESVDEDDLDGDDLLDDEDGSDDGKKKDKKKKKGSDATSAADGLEIPAPLTSMSEQILTRKAYTVSYNKDTRLPNWVAWHLTKEHASGDVPRAKNAFREDEDVRAPRATRDDYYNSQYDRGHMCPAGDNKWDETAMYESFLLTNICPQNHGLNDGDWKELEQKCRTWAEEYGDIYIVCGPLLQGTEHKTIGKNKVVVPEGFFKVVLCTTGSPKAIGFVYSNKYENRAMTDYTKSVDEIESLTGIDFFPTLPDDIETAVEAAGNLKDW